MKKFKKRKNINNQNGHKRKRKFKWKKLFKLLLNIFLILLLIGLIGGIILIIGALFTGKLSLDALSGPVGMYTVVKQASAFGLLNLIYLTAYLSINLGVMNILPFPAFDGGHVLFIFIELITRKRVNEKFENMCHLIGFILIFGLMILITFKDIFNLFI